MIHSNEIRLLLMTHSNILLILLPITHHYGPPVAPFFAPCRRRLGLGWAAEPGAAGAPQVTLAAPRVKSMGSLWGILWEYTRPGYD